MARSKEEIKEELSTKNVDDTFPDPFIIIIELLEKIEENTRK